MNLSRSSFAPGKLGLFVAAVCLGLGVGTLARAEPVAVPGIGSVSGVLAGGAALVVGASLYGTTKRLSSGCGCGGDCDC